MSEFIKSVVSHPLFLIVLAVITVYLVMHIVRGLLRLFIALALLIGIYAGYMTYTGRDMPTMQKTIAQQCATLIEKAQSLMDDIKHRAPSDGAKK